MFDARRRTLAALTRMVHSPPRTYGSHPAAVVTGGLHLVGEPRKWAAATIEFPCARERRSYARSLAG